MTTDINIINVNGLDYPIKDREARTIAESAVTMFAYYEGGLVASQAYSKVGTLIFWKDALYETLTTIAKGEIWQVGVNLSPSDKAGVILSELKDELTANGNRIYMDYQNGKYGYNTSPNRGADTFRPFSDMQPIYDAIVAAGVTPASDSVEDIVAAIALIDKKHTVSFWAQYRGDTSIETSVTVDGSQTRHYTATGGSVSETVTI